MLLKGDIVCGVAIRRRGEEYALPANPKATPAKSVLLRGTEW